MDHPRVLVCGGRQVNDRLQPVGDPCGRRLAGRGLTLVEDELHDQARVRGWSVVRLPDGTLLVTCDRCRRPDPVVAELARTVPAPLGGHPTTATAR